MYGYEMVVIKLVKEVCSQVVEGCICYDKVFGFYLEGYREFDI